MPENAQKIAQKNSAKAEKPLGTGVLRLMVLENLHLYTEAATIKIMLLRLKDAGCVLHKETLYTILKEIKARPTPGYELKSKNVRCGKTQGAAYYLTKIKYKKP